MRVIFLENIENHKVGDIKEVQDGYARNFLLKKGIAVIATEDEVSKLAKKMDKLKEEEAENTKKSEELSEKLSKVKLEIKMQASAEDTEGRRKLFGSVTNAEIAENLKEKGYEIDKKDIETGEKINELGNYEITVKLGHGVTVDLPLKVVAKE